MDFKTWLIAYKNKSLKTAALYNYWANRGKNMSENEFAKQKNSQSKRLMYFSIKYYCEYKGKPFYKMEPPKIKKGKERVFVSLKDYRQIVDGFINNNPNYSYSGKILAELTFIYGLRISEALNLKANDVKLEHMIVKGKGQKIRIIPISKQFSWFFRDRNDYVCSLTGKKMSYSTARTILDLIKKDIKLDPETTWHSFRHGFAVRLLLNKIDLYTISKLMGHKSIETTTTYLRFNLEETRIEFKKLGLFV